MRLVAAKHTAPSYGETQNLASTMTWIIAHVMMSFHKPQDPKKYIMCTEYPFPFMHPRVGITDTLLEFISHIHQGSISIVFKCKQSCSPPIPIPHKWLPHFQHQALIRDPCLHHSSASGLEIDGSSCGHHGATLPSREDHE